MPTYYVHFTVPNEGSGHVIMEASVPLCSQDIKALTKKIRDDVGFPPDFPPEKIDIDFIFELADRKGGEDV